MDLAWEKRKAEQLKRHAELTRILNERLARMDEQNLQDQKAKAEEEQRRNMKDAADRLARERRDAEDRERQDRARREREREDQQRRLEQHAREERLRQEEENRRRLEEEEEEQQEEEEEEDRRNEERIAQQREEERKRKEAQDKIDQDAAKKKKEQDDKRKNEIQNKVNELNNTQAKILQDQKNAEAQKTQELNDFDNKIKEIKNKLDNLQTRAGELSQDEKNQKEQMEKDVKALQEKRATLDKDRKDMEEKYKADIAEIESSKKCIEMSQQMKKDYENKIDEIHDKRERMSLNSKGGSVAGSMDSTKRQEKEKNAKAALSGMPGCQGDSRTDKLAKEYGTWKKEDMRLFDVLFDSITSQGGVQSGKQFSAKPGCNAVCLIESFSKRKEMAKCAVGDDKIYTGACSLHKAPYVFSVQVKDNKPYTVQFAQPQQ